MIHIHQNILNKTHIISFLLLMTMGQFIYGQNVTGPTPVAANSTQTYEYDAGSLLLGYSWVISGGTVVSSGLYSRTTKYYVNVQWGAAGSGSVIIKNIFQNLGSLNVTITGGGSSNPPTGTVLSNENYVYTIIPQIASTDVTTLDNDQKIETVTYVDGLGRPKQNIAIRGGGDKEDIITHITYDNIGRQDKEYLPFALSNNGGAYKSNALTETNNFYNTAKYQNTTNPYSEKYFEDSPLNRVHEQGAPGASWSLNKASDTDHTIKFKYRTNTSATEVRKYTVSLASDYTPTLVNPSPYYYEVGQLYKTITKDENWKAGDGLNKTTEEFTDKLGRVVLKRTYNNSQKHDTYYVYDDYGNLTYVLPPKTESTSAVPTGTELSELCYQYKYDKRNRLIRKKIPGKDWEYIVYDQLDRPVLTQDGLGRTKSPDEWLFTKYDALGRVAYTGIYRTNSLRAALQSQFDNKTAAQNYEDKVSSGTGFAGTYYTNNDYPTGITASDILTVNYYDNYTFNRAGAATSVNSYGVTSSTNAKGLATGTRVKVLGVSPEKWITTVTYYDNKARAIYSYIKNDYLSTTEILKSKLDFTGRILETTAQHTKSGQATITTVDAFAYDHVGRVTKQTQMINGQVANTELIAENQYDELGQLVSKGIGNLASNTTQRLQTIDYTYTVRGWLKTINQDANNDNDLFNFTLMYDDIADVNKRLYNGNISQTSWNTLNTDSSIKTYTYTYDGLNRITSAIDNTGHYNLTSVSYDKNGNILSLNRKGHLNSTTTSFGVMDNLVYTYDSGNKLKKVLDNGNDTYGFKDGANIATEYTYDQNGNMKTDANKGITSILYNHLNLPTEVKFDNSNTKKITYTYDANGTKLRKVVNDNGNITTTDYADNGAIYENNVLQFIPTAEGYVMPISGGNWQYVYQYKDHLGNIRLSYSDNILKNGIIEQNEIIEENNYYPFGLKHKGYNTNVSANGNSTAQKFKYNGIELEEGLDLNLYEMDVRSYDPAIARFTSIDPVVHHYQSTYTAFDNNPIFWADPSGANSQTIYDFEGNAWSIDCLNGECDNARRIDRGDGNEENNTDPNETSESITYTFKGNGKHELTLNTTSTYTTYYANALTGEKTRKVTYKHTSVTVYLLLNRDESSGYIEGSYEILKSSEEVVITSNPDDYFSKDKPITKINKPVKINNLYSLIQSEGGRELLKQVKFLRKLNADNASVNANYLNVAETNLSSILGYGGVATTVAAMAGKDKRFFLFVAAAGAGNSVGNEIRKTNFRKSAVIWKK